MTLNVETIIPSLEQINFQGTFSADAWEYNQADYTYNQSGLMYNQIGGRVGAPPQLILGDQNDVKPHIASIKDFKP